MAETLNDILTRIEAVAGQSLDVTEGDDDFNLRRSYVNRAQQDWAEKYDWPQLYTEYLGNTSLGTGNATITLPSDFRKLAGYPKFSDELNTYQYPEINPTDRDLFTSSDKYVYKLGDLKNGYNLIVNPAPLVSGASIFIPYYRFPASLVSGSNVSECPNSNYLVQQGLYYYFLANEDARFQDARSEAEQILANMLESSEARGAGYDNSVPNVDDKAGFKWGKS